MASLSDNFIWTLILITFTTSQIFFVEGFIFEYFLPQRNDESTNMQVDDMTLVPYELAEKDEKFLKEAAKYTGASMTKLDLCHQRVILTLKDSCHELYGERLGKLSVMLLNCQSDTEGRTVYECTEAMTLKECTIKMDPDTWNAYHLITNRAKAICTSVRQDQFRGLTEMTVNKLMKSAHEQINMMDRLSSNQAHLEKVTAFAIDDLSENHIKLIQQQREMAQIADKHRTSVEDSLSSIMKEKSLIKAGQMEVAEMIIDLKNQLDDGMESFKNQFSESKMNHIDLLNDLDDLHKSALKISEKLTETTEYVLTQNELASGQFEDTMKHLNDIKTIIFTLSTLLEQVQATVDNKLNWILDKVGDTETFITHINIVLSHLSYLLLGMLIIVFVNASAFYRISFVAIVVLNFFATLLNFYPLDIFSLTCVLCTGFAGKLFSELLFGGYFKNMLSLQNEDEIKNKNYKGSKPIASNNNQLNEDRTNLERDTPVRRWLNDNVDQRSATPFSTTMESYRTKCTAYTTKGIRCRNAATGDSLFCRIHI